MTPGLPIATLGAVCLGSFSAWWSLHGGDQAVLESAHAVPLNPADPKQRVLDNVVEEIAIAGGLPKPAIYVIPDSDPNAFATGQRPGARLDRRHARACSRSSTATSSRASWRTSCRTSRTTTCA